jgi:hypothetical protein
MAGCKLAVSCIYLPAPVAQQQMRVGYSVGMPHTVRRVDLQYITTNYDYFLVLLWYLITFERLRKCLKIGHDSSMSTSRPGHSIAHASCIEITKRMQIKIMADTCQILPRPVAPVASVINLLGL